MKLAKWIENDGVVRVGLFEDDRVTPLATPDPAAPDRALLDLAMARSSDVAPIGPPRPRSDVRLLPPVSRPGMLRDYSTFEEHARAARKGLQNLELPDLWYSMPVGYFNSPHRIFGDGEVVPRPDETEELDFELEVAAVIGRDASDLSDEEAPSVIAGYTIYNDWSARDIQRKEKQLGGGGPSKSKDFANSLGPILVTPDELGGEEDRPEAEMLARVNGRDYSRGNLKGMHFSFAHLVAYTSKDAVIRAGDVIASGTCGTGCILELSLTHGVDEYPWLEPGDLVELEVEGIGTLRNVVARW